MTTTSTRAGAAPAWKVWSALWIVYIVWGSTYLAIRVVVETMPPLLSAGARFLLAGILLYTWCRIKNGSSAVRLSGRELGASALVGSALLMGGNGLVTAAENIGATSSIAALMVASIPLWVIVWRVIDREKIGAGTLIGVAIGFVGVAVLVMPGNAPKGVPTLSLIMLIGASISWATGSFYSKRLPLPKDPLLSTATQMLCGGAVLLVTALLTGEANGLQTGSFSGASIAGFIYLVLAGSIVAFTAYVWLLQNAPISKVATYAYVNPVIAILLGWLILSEHITAMTLVGAAVIVSSVAFIVNRESSQTKQAAEPIPTAQPELVRADAS